MKKFAVVLAGSGVYDGSEIQEAVLTLLAIAKAGASYQCFAPNIYQYHVVDHSSGKETKESRNVFVESARIARGNILKLQEFDPSEFDAIIFPGGFGVAKNLCTFAIDGPDCLVNPVVEQAIKKSIKAQLPIGALCIAPALLAKVVGKSKLTIGTDTKTAAAIESLGAIHQNTLGADVVIDHQNKIVSSPCYMHNTTIDVVAQGAENAIQALFSLMSTT